MESNSSESADKSNEKAPKPGTLAIVQCEGFRCLASLDANNIWRDFHTGQQLQGVKAVVVLFPDERARLIRKNPGES